MNEVVSTRNVKMGTLNKLWGGKNVKSITFCVTEDCNLACKYCYLVGKNKTNKMSFDMAKQAVDYILSNRQEFNEDGVIWDFIGGEPFLEIDLIDRLSDYIKQQMFLLDHPWFNKYRFNFSTNGVLYHLPKVQEYIHKNKGHISIGISVDGNKLKHDLQRIKPDGSGSYDDVVKNVPLWLEQFPETSTKATFASSDLPHLKDSILSLWNIGIKTVAANVVFENVWMEGDDEIFENQLKELADYIIENKSWDDYSVRFFDQNIGFPLNEEDLERNFCGSGEMLAIDYKGNLFPCIRFADYSMNNREGYSIGDIYNGINHDRLRPFMGLSLKAQSTEECINCEVASGCAWCTGYNYDCADTDTIYQRATFICKMHKANVRANEYFWNRYTEATGYVSPLEENRRSRISPAADTPGKFLQIIASDDMTPHCSYQNWNKTRNRMSEELLKKAFQFAEENGFHPVVMGYEDGISGVVPEEAYTISGSQSQVNASILVYDNEAAVCRESQTGVAVLQISKENMSRLAELVRNLAKTYNRINLVLQDIEKWNQADVESYENELGKVCEAIIETYREDSPVEVNVLTDILNLDSMRNCDAGTNTFTLAPNGKFYICPAFYFDSPENCLGDIESGINIKNRHLFELKNAPICSECDVHHCKRCKFINKKLTSEYNTPPKLQCIISHIERNKARELQMLLKKENLHEFEHLIPEINYLDPLDKIMKKKERSL
jgi:uncharacterized protein